MLGNVWPDRNTAMPDFLDPTNNTLLWWTAEYQLFHKTVGSQQPFHVRHDVHQMMFFDVFKGGIRRNLDRHERAVEFRHRHVYGSTGHQYWPSIVSHRRTGRGARQPSLPDIRGKSLL